MTAGALARATGLTTGAITGVVDRPERAGLAIRDRDPADRRKVVVRLAAAAEARAAPLFAPMERASRAAFARYDEAGLALLLDCLTGLRDAADDALGSIAQTSEDGSAPSS